MDDTKNALAELAEWLKKQEGSFPVLANQFQYEDERDMHNIAKVQRIIAELAKVSEGRWVEYCGSKFYLCRLGGHVIEMAVGKCRAIAEEKEEKQSETQSLCEGPQGRSSYPCC